MDFITVYRVNGSKASRIHNCCSYSVDVRLELQCPSDLMRRNVCRDRVR
jgi:hypothetical protein